MDANQLSCSFQAVCASFRLPLELSTKTAESLLASYSEPQRHYHTLNHVGHMISQLADNFKSFPPASKKLTDIFHFAIWFHDVVYDPIKGAPFNENASIEVWETFVNEAEPYLNHLKDDVTCLIKATIQHTIPPENEIPALISSSFVGCFLDLDLAILASPAEDYEAYAKQIRQEYIHVSDADYRDGRRKVLQNFMEREKIFFVDRELDEAQARFNLAAEIEALGGPKQQKD